MSSPLTIVMYHYVRDFTRSRYPRIKGLDVAGFRRQLDHLASTFRLVTMEDVIAAVRGEAPLAPDAALLTFDDGYLDHYTTVFPVLSERRLQGSFFPPVAPVRDAQLLDVNRVHFVLASAPSSTLLAELIDERISALDADERISSVADYRAQWAHPNRFDDADTIYVKRMLQTALPPDIRDDLARGFFARFVSVDEETFASELYFNSNQAKVMVDCGMFLGSHGTSHIWLNHVDRATQEAEIDGSLTFLRSLGMPVDEHWVMCYPYGGWNESVVETARRRGCAVGVTTEAATAMIGTHDPLLLPRYDTNDFPQ